MSRGDYLIGDISDRSLNYCIMKNTNGLTSFLTTEQKETFGFGGVGKSGIHNSILHINLELSGEAPRASARGIFTASAKPAEAYPPSLTCSPNLPSLKRLVQTGKSFGIRELRRIPFSHSSPSFRTGHSAKAGKFYNLLVR